MPNTREKLIELLKECFDTGIYGFDEIADHLISNDVVTVLRCKDCKHYKVRKPFPSYNGQTKSCCRSANTKVSDDDFCSFGERKES